MNFHPGLWGTNVEVTGGYFALTGINKGRGYLVQMTDSTSSLIWNRNHIISTPDTLISNSAGGQVSSDSNFQAATAVMLDVPSPTAFLNTNYTNSTTSLTNVGDLNFTLAKSQAYAFRCELYYQAAATGGLQVGFSGPATNSFIYGVEIATDNATGTPYNTGVGTALATKIPTASVAVAKAATNYVAHVSGSINPSAVGVLQLQGASAAAATLTVNRGSYCKLYSQSSFQ